MVARWGAKQTKLYFQQLHDSAEYIAKHQRTISRRDDLTDHKSLSACPVGEHSIVYAPIDDSKIAIAALIRRALDVALNPLEERQRK